MAEVQATKADKVRVYELAREMLVDSKVVLRILERLGVPAKNHMSTMDKETADKVVGILTGKIEEPKPKKKASRPDAEAGRREAKSRRDASGASTARPRPPEALQPAGRIAPRDDPATARLPRGTKPGPARPDRPAWAREGPRPPAAVHPGRAKPFQRPGAGPIKRAPTAPPRPSWLGPGSRPTWGPGLPAGVTRRDRPRPDAEPRRYGQQPAPTPARPPERPEARPPIAKPARPAEPLPTQVEPPRRQPSQQIARHRPAEPAARHLGSPRRPEPRREAGGRADKQMGTPPPTDVQLRQGPPAPAAKPQVPVVTKKVDGRRQAIEELRKEVRKEKEIVLPKKRGRTDRVVPELKKQVEIPGSMTVGALASKMGISAAEAIKKLMSLGVMATVNQQVDPDTAIILGGELGIEVVHKPEEKWWEKALEEEADDPSSLVPRPPVVTVMGHVDHGKTSLLDAIRHTKVTAKEAGGITQHIGAYAVQWKGKDIVFIDTPGHEAFTAMRARGAKVTDIAVLVVAADDGVMPQTVEAYNHAKAAGVPVVVAINKIDRPNANPDMVKRQLNDVGLIPEEWGGDAPVVLVSAKDGRGIDDLLEVLLLVAEIQDIKANPQARARGTVIEARLDKGRGPVATVLVLKGTLKTGETFVVGRTWGRVRALFDFRGKRVRKAGPAVPVEVVGLSDLPEAGDLLQVIADEKAAKEIAQVKSMQAREQAALPVRHAALEDLMAQAEGEQKELNLVVKGDVKGTLEAVRGALERLSSPEVKLSIIHQGVGAISESDVMLAAASGAMIIGFNVRPDVNARQAADAQRVDVRVYDVIYDAVKDIEAAMKGMIAPKITETVLGKAEVRATFKIPKVGVIAGCHVSEGKVTKSSRVRVIRDSIVIHTGRISSLKRFKDDVREVTAGYECGVGIASFNDVREGDVLEAFEMEEVSSGGDSRAV